jgi:hypothetical protein
MFSDELNMSDLIMDLAFDGDDGEISAYLNRTAIQSESHDGRYNPTYGYKYDEVFAPKFTFIKRDYKDFTADEVRTLLKYLTSIDTTSLLEVYYDDSNAPEFCAIGNWSEISLYKIANNRTIGVTATFESVYPFALSDLHTVTKTITSADDNKIIINIDTDDSKPVYPRVTIKENGPVVKIPEGTVYTAISDMVENTVYFNGKTYYWKTKNSQDSAYFNSATTNPNLATTSVRFRNTHTDDLYKSTVLDATVVKNNNTTENIVLDGANKIVSSNGVNRIFGNDFNWKWLELHDGKNEITIEGNCEVIIQYREVRKIGEY